jgi:hypothetical protein
MKQHRADIPQHLFIGKVKEKCHGTFCAERDQDLRVTMKGGRR